MFDASARNTNATRVGGVEDLNGGADRSAAEIPSERDRTRTRDLSARAARTVLTDKATRAECLDVPAALPVLDRSFAGCCGLSGGKLFLVYQLPRAAVPGCFRPALILAPDAIFEIVRMAYVVSAGGFTPEDVDPVWHKRESHPIGWLEGLCWRGRRDSNPRPPA